MKRVNSSLSSEYCFYKLDLSKQTKDKEFALGEQIRSLKDDNKDMECRIKNQTIQQKPAGSGEWQALTPVNSKSTNV